VKEGKHAFTVTKKGALYGFQACKCNQGYITKRKGSNPLRFKIKSMKNKLKSLTSIFFFEDGYIENEERSGTNIRDWKSVKDRIRNPFLRILKPSVKNKERFSSWLEFEQDFQ